MPGQNSGSLSAARTRGRRRGRREGTLAWSAAWPAAATSCVVCSAKQAAVNLDDKRIRGAPLGPPRMRSAFFVLTVWIVHQHTLKYFAYIVYLRALLRELHCSFGNVRRSKPFGNNKLGSLIGDCFLQAIRCRLTKR
jgi:hypothetical protein